MKTNFKIGITFLIISISIISCSPIELTLKSLNLSKTDMIVDIESYNSKGNLKRSPSFISKGKADSSQNAQETQYKIDAFKGGVVKLKYKPYGSNATFNLSEIKIPESKNFPKVFFLADIKTYNETDEKQKLLGIAKNLNLENTKEFYRLVDIKKLLGTLIIGKIEDSVLNPNDYYNLIEEKIEYDKTKHDKSNAITTQSVITDVSLTIPIYGSVQSSFANDNLHQVMWDIIYYHYFSSFNAGKVITNLSNDEKEKLLATLKLYNLDDEIYILRNFYIIESGSFTTTSATKIETSADAAIASVFTAKGAYTFKSEDSKFTTLQSQAYNLKFVKLMTIKSLIGKLNGDKSYNFFKEEIFTPKLILK